MKRLIIAVLIVLAALESVRAYLGDGSDRVDDLYGNIVQRKLRDDGTVSVLYHKDRYLYQVTFANDRSIAETYFSVKGTDLSEKEIAKFLKANSAGATWTPVNTGSERRFKRSDGNANATYGRVNGRLGLTVREVSPKT